MKEYLPQQINPNNKPRVNSAFQLQIDAIRPIDQMEKVRYIISQKKALLKNRKDAHEFDM